jgi:hypothetical protein
LKPVIIITIAIVCSVVAVFAVLLSLQEIAIYQYNEENNKELERRDKLTKGFESTKQLLIKNCREHYIGQLSEMNRCIESAEYGTDRALTQGINNPNGYTPPTCTLPPTQQMLIDSLENDDSIDESIRMEKAIQIMKQWCVWD